jgi:hypothetical protein
MGEPHTCQEMEVDGWNMAGSLRLLDTIFSLGCLQWSRGEKKGGSETRTDDGHAHRGGARHVPRVRLKDAASRKKGFSRQERRGTLFRLGDEWGMGEGPRAGDLKDRRG